MATREKRLIVDGLDLVMARLGWPRQDLFGMGSAYAKDWLVTPYYFPQVAGAAGKKYLVMEGYIGVIHRGFEHDWLGMAGRENERHDFCVLSLIANFRELREVRFIEPSLPLREQVDAFGHVVANFLETLPSDESTLVAAFESNVLCGKRLDFSFASMARPEKFQAFSQFVARLAAERRGRTG